MCLSVRRLFCALHISCVFNFHLFYVQAHWNWVGVIYTSLWFNKWPSVGFILHANYGEDDWNCDTKEKPKKNHLINVRRSILITSNPLLIHLFRLSHFHCSAHFNYSFFVTWVGLVSFCFSPRHQMLLWFALSLVISSFSYYIHVTNQSFVQWLVWNDTNDDHAELWLNLLLKIEANDKWIDEITNYNLYLA